MSDISDRTSENTVYADAVGATVAPARYNRGGRETIDTQRDVAGFFFESAIEQGVSTRDAAFYTHCVLTALAYRARQGAKDAAELEQAKINWYLQMAGHVVGNGPDPREKRPNFVPYTPEDGLEILVSLLTSFFGSDPLRITPSMMAGSSVEAREPAEPVTCPVCGGTGRAVRVTPINPDGSFEPKDAPSVTCMVCKESGTVTPDHAPVPQATQAMALEPVRAALGSLRDELVAWAESVRGDIETGRHVQLRDQILYKLLVDLDIGRSKNNASTPSRS